MIVISWSIENRLVLRTILIGSMIVIVSWAIENNSQFEDYSSWVYEYYRFLAY